MVPKKAAEDTKISTTINEDERDPWELESGLPNDVDAWIANAKFGTKSEYQQRVATSGVQDETSGIMFLCDLVGADGELLGNQGWSVGSGFHVEDDGETLAHPIRKNVVATSRYGQLQFRVVNELKIDMRQYGKPLKASTWNGLGFHWMLEKHETLKETESGREKKDGLMPTLFINVNKTIREEGVASPSSSRSEGEEEVEISPALKKKLVDLAQTNTQKDFIRAAARLPDVAANEDLMNMVLDDGPDGFFQKNQ